MKETPVIIRQAEDFSYQFGAADFDPEHWIKKKDSKVLAGGRGGSVKIILNNQPCVLRKYLRGGLMQNLLVDRYFWMGLENCRAYREHRVIEHAVNHDLPVPPVLAYYIHRTGMFYRSAIINRYIDNQGTLASYLSSKSLAASAWSKLGALVRQMHQARINHADLNANNILIDHALNFHMIDFDKAVIEDSVTDWAAVNVERLLRSLNKIKRLRQQQGLAFHFEDSDWQAFMAGYK